MTRLKVGSPLHKELTGKPGPTYLQRILLHLLYVELKDQYMTTTKEISSHLNIKYNTANTTLHRMKDYEYISGKKTTVTDYKVNLLFDTEIREITVIGDKRPENISDSDIVHKKKKKLVFWKLTKGGRRYAKQIWFDPGKYGLIEDQEEYFIHSLSNNDRFWELQFEKEEYIKKRDEMDEGEAPVQKAISPEEIEYQALNQMSFPFQKENYILNKYFKMNQLVGIPDFKKYDGADYIVIKPLSGEHRLKIKRIPSSMDGIIFKKDEQEFLKKDEKNQICVMSTSTDKIPRIIAFISFEHVHMMDDPVELERHLKDRRRDFDDKVKRITERYQRR